MRIALQTSADRLRNNVDRKIPWLCVEAVWGWLTTTIRTFSALLPSNIPLAWCRLAAALHLMVDALSATNQWQRVDNHRAGEIWIRVGLDGVPLWKSHVVACTVAATSKLKDYEPHAPKRHFVCTLLRGTDTVETLKAALEKAELVQDVHNLNGTT